MSGILPRGGEAGGGDRSSRLCYFGNGGAAIEGQLIAAGGEQVGKMSYAWYENDIEWAATGGTWSDANRALDRFASKTAKTLGN